jgi:hypothetical protein
MGVDRSDYLIYGFKMEPNYLESKGVELFEDSKYLPFIEGWKGEDYSIVYDQMMGKYCVFGFRIAYADSEGFRFLGLPAEGWPIQAEQVKAKFKEVFGFNCGELGEPEVLLFSHYW